MFDGTPMINTIKNCTDPVKFCLSRQVTGGALWSDKLYPDNDEYKKYIDNELKQNKALEKRNDDYKKKFVLKDAEYIGKVVRFYYSTNGKPMYYKKSGNRVPKSDGCYPMMELKKKIPADLDYNKYFELAEIHLKEIR